MQIRPYHDEDYGAVKALYLQGDLYGGQFDEARDSRDKLGLVTKMDPESILVCEDQGRILGTISLIENGRVAWLFRFAVARSPSEKTVTDLLYQKACSILCARGHEQVLVYSPINHAELGKRYQNLGMSKGGAYACFWQRL